MVMDKVNALILKPTGLGVGVAVKLIMESEQLMGKCLNISVLGELFSPYTLLFRVELLTYLITFAC